MARQKPLEERFWSKVKKGKNGECWEWQGALFKAGYGAIGSGPRPSTALCAHRVSWEIHHGNIPDDLYVCHTCDNRKCVNPDHMFLGTHADNQRDMAIKGRGNAVLKPSDIPRIRLLREQGMSTPKIARRFGVTAGAIGAIVNGNTWTWIA